jgi:hypothetical protein
VTGLDSISSKQPIKEITIPPIQPPIQFESPQPQPPKQFRKIKPLSPKIKKEKKEKPKTSNSIETLQKFVEGESENLNGILNAENEDGKKERIDRVFNMLENYSIYSLHGSRAKKLQGIGVMYANTLNMLKSKRAYLQKKHKVLAEILSKIHPEEISLPTEVC